MLEKEEVLEAFMASVLLSAEHGANHAVTHDETTGKIGYCLISDVLNQYKAGITEKTILLEATPQHLNEFEGDAQAFIEWVEGEGAEVTYKEAIRASTII